MNDADGADFLLWQKLAVIQSGCGVVHCVDVGSGDGEGLGFMCEAEIAFLVLVINIRYLS